jgi:hypothetical protein
VNGYSTHCPATFPFDILEIKQRDRQETDSTVNVYPAGLDSVNSIFMVHHLFKPFRLLKSLKPFCYLADSSPLSSQVQQPVILGFAPFPPPQPPADPDLLAYYSFDDGTAADNSGNGRDGVWVVGPPA